VGAIFDLRQLDITPILVHSTREALERFDEDCAKPTFGEGEVH